ncbi:hypothetical protein J6590_029683 [Homalodisca vitripennis]|nr:hypothetical protein J6590_029683 [Homalodisca vitripennis]
MTAYTVYMIMSQNVVSDQPNLSISLSNFPGVHVAVSADQQTTSNLIQNLVRSGGATPDVVPADTNFNNYLGGQIKDSLIKYEREMIAGFQYNSSVLLGEFSHYFLHSPAIVFNLVANILLQQISPSSAITVSNHPITVQMNLDICDLALQAPGKAELFPMRMTVMTLGLMIVSMSFISYPLKERVNNSKQLQLMTGVSPLLYWFTNLLCDFIIFIITAILMLAALYIFQTQDILSSSGYIGTLILVFLLFGLSGISFAYLFSFFVQSSVKASVLFILINLFTGTIASVVINLLAIDPDIPFIEVYIFIFSFNPIFAGSSAFMHLFSAMYIDGTCLQCGSNCQTQDPLQFLDIGDKAEHPHGILNFIIFLVVDTILYSGVVLMIEYGLAKRLWFMICSKRIKMEHKQMEEDTDVLLEKEHVIASSRGNSGNRTVLQVNDLGKKYNRKATAVYGVSFQVGRGECFGLLGVNGAGKTTTFKMLTGEEIPNKGDARILQLSLHKQKSTFLSQIGYCPQFDAINKLLTGKEMLRVYALLRGVPLSLCDFEISKWINMMGLKEYADRPCGTYSGGNKRKLSTAMAFIGEPPVVFLDEPTSGVDPVSRRKLWEVVSKCQQAGQAIVLTSHSMEECEALCSRLTIMVAGHMKCIGTPEYLKHKFGQGFTIKIKLRSSQRSDVLGALKQDMMLAFRVCSIKDEHLGLLHYHVPDAQIPLSLLFSKMEGLKQRHDIIDDYNISDTSLEQVFMHFARAQTKAEV